MKKSLVALAILGTFGGAALAQSSVTIYGLVDLAVKKGNGGTSSNSGALGTSDAWDMSQSSTSRLGFRGTEDLGGGLSAQFQIEHRFNPDTGTLNVPSIFWAGRSYVQLTSAGVGSVYLGREYSPTFWIQLKSDAFGNDGVGQSGGYMFAGYAGTDAGSAVRTSNTAGFRSANFGGLSFEVATAASETSQLGRNDGLNVEYKGGPFYAGVGYSKISGGTTKNDDELANVGLAYDLGMVKLMGYYARAKVGNGSRTNHTGSLAATAPLAGGLLKAGYTVYDPAGGNNKVRKVGLGYNYPLSKRTNLYTDLGVAKEDRRTRNTAYSFGVKHLF